jgi:hypothetical protein
MAELKNGTPVRTSGGGEEASVRLLGAPGTSEGRLWRWGPAAFKLSGDEDGDLMARPAQAGCAA